MFRCYYPQKKVYVTFEMCRSSKKSSDLYSRRAGILKRRPCSTFIENPSAIKHQSHKCLGKAFPKIPQRPPFCKEVQCKPNANNARVDKWIGLLRCDMHSGSNKILIPPPRLKSLIFQGDVFGLGFEFWRGVPLRSTRVPQTGKPDCSPAWPQQGGKESWTPPWKLSCFFLETSQMSLGADFKNHFPNSVIRCHTPY